MKLIIIFALAIAFSMAANLDSITKSKSVQTLIINGHPAKKGEAAFIVSLKSRSHFCAGSIIDEHWVVTAAHCLFLKKFEIVAGLHKRFNESGVQIRTISSKDYQFVHEKYVDEVGPYDIGLIYIEEPFNLNTASHEGSAPVSKVNLPSGRYSEYGKGKVYGWGHNNYGFSPNTLQTLDVNIISYMECKAALPTSAPLDPVNICSYTANKTDGICNGDSGGPLIRNTASGTEIVGIASWGAGQCASTSYPSVYTRISYFKDWIYKIIDNFDPSNLSKLIVDEN